MILYDKLPENPSKEAVAALEQAIKKSCLAVFFYSSLFFCGTYRLMLLLMVHNK